jgi:hypothetical protein
MLRIVKVVGSLVAAVAVLLMVAVPAGAMSACDSAKLKCMRKKAQCLLKVEERALKTGLPPDAEKLARCRTKFEDAVQGCIAKVEAKQQPAKPATVCTVVGDAAALETVVDEFVAAAVVQIGGGPPTPCAEVSPGASGASCYGAPCPSGAECIPVSNGLSGGGQVEATRCGCATSPTCTTCAGPSCAGMNCPPGAVCWDVCSVVAACGCVE